MSTKWQTWLAACPAGRVLSAALLAVAALTAPSAAEEWKPPAITMPKAAQHPFIACTPEELARLRAAWKGGGAERDAVAAVVGRADRALKGPLAFPPRGGQHNQWYQCDACQIALRTVDDTHHQCPRCKKVYTGEPYDDVIFAHRHGANLKNMTDAAWAWAATGDRKYAEFAARVLLGYAERYEKYPYHDSSRRQGAAAGRSGGRLAEQTLNEAGTLSREVAPAYDLIHSSGVLSAADHEAVRAGLLLPMLKNIEKNHAGKSNWQTWHNAAFIWGGAMVEDAAWLRLAVEDPQNGFLYQMRASVTSDGMWYENSWGYHFYTLQAMVTIAEGARRLGIDLWHHPALAAMFTLPVRYTMADGSLPRFGDDVRSSAAGLYVVAPAYHALKDPAMESLLPARPSLDAVLFGRPAGARERPRIEGSEVFRGAGHAILRARGEAGLSAAMTFGPYGGFHGHLDKLTFVFFGWGRELGVDPGRAASQAYRLPIHRDWYKATLGHNAVLVDGASQKPAEGKLESFAAADAYGGAAARCDAAYDGVRHRRLLVMTPTYLLVADDLAAERPRRFDWLYHNRGSAVSCAAAAAAGAAAAGGSPGALAALAAPGEKFPGQEYLQNVRAGTTDGPVRAEFAADAATTHLLAAAATGTEVRTADGPGASVMERVPLVVLTRRGPSARFAAVLEPVRKGAAPAVSAVALADSPQGLRVTVQNGAAAETATIAPAGTFTFAVGGKIVLEGK
ncbi:MAG: alginate lyase family protein [Planctomycetes bacterium]|nr:alginate lyase family protein [Planctomycetota bacterium]